jgi:hypothetical protein
MQKEFASMWNAVNELNQMDTEKDEEINKLLHERDQALREKENVLIQLRDMRQMYKDLKTELKVCKIIYHILDC